MLGAVADNRTVATRVVRYAGLTIAATLALIPVADMNWLYTAVSIAAAAWFGWLVIDLHRSASAGAKIGKKKAMKVFHGSISYLAVVFLAIAVDSFL